MSSEVALDLHKVIDDNITSCIPTLSLLGAKDVYSGNIHISQYNSTMDKYNIAFRVTFNGKVTCAHRKVK